MKIEMENRKECLEVGGVTNWNCEQLMTDDCYLITGAGDWHATISLQQLFFSYNKFSIYFFFSNDF